MRLFLSWSMARSRAVGLALRPRIEHIVQNVDVFVSSADIYGGQEWWAEIKSNAQSCDAAFILVTPENLDRPWLNFEAGAFALMSRPAIPIVIGGSNALLSDSPLRNLQAVTLEDSDKMRDIFVSLDPDRATAIEHSFAREWSQLYADMMEAFEATQPEVDVPEARPSDPVMEEVLSTLRRLDGQYLPPQSGENRHALRARALTAKIRRAMESLGGSVSGAHGEEFSELTITYPPGRAEAAERVLKNELALAGLSYSSFERTGGDRETIVVRIRFS